MLPTKPRRGRKLLVASLGIAAVSVVGTGCTTVANLPAPPPCDDAGHFNCTDAQTAHDVQDVSPAADATGDADAGD